MTKFHTDEYVHFLNRVTPETAEELTYHGTRCESLDIPVYISAKPFQSWLAKTTPHSKGCSSSAPFLLEGP